MSDASESFKDITRELRRTRILEAAVAVFSEYGFRGASMKQIAKQAGVAEGTIYNVFEDKLDLLVSLLDPLSQRTLPETAAAKTGISEAISQRLAVFDESTSSMMRVLLSEALIDPEVREHFGERIIRPLNGGRKSDGVAYGALALVLGCVVLRLLGEDDPRREKQAVAALGELGPAKRGRS